MTKLHGIDLDVLGYVDSNRALEDDVELVSNVAHLEYGLSLFVDLEHDVHGHLRELRNFSLLKELS
jgi:hypothetical protein